MCTNAVGILEMRQDIIINTLNNSFNSHSWWDEDRGDFFFRVWGVGGGGCWLMEKLFFFNAKVILVHVI